MRSMSAATECVANIGPRGRAMRQRFGIVMLALAVAAAVVLVVLDVARPWRLTLFVPFLLGAVGVFQARAST